MTADDFDITMACLDAIEQEVRRAREALLATRDAELPARVAWCPDCRVVHSSCRICNEWDHRHVTFDEPLPAGAPIASKTARSDHPSLAHAWEARERHHQEHHQDAHTPREQPQTRSGGTESGEVGLSGTCARCGAPITVPMSDPENREMAVCTPCEIGLLREGYQQARGQVDAVRSLAKQMRHEAASVQPMTERGVGLWDAAAAITYTLDRTRSEPAPDCSHSTATTDRK